MRRLVSKLISYHVMSAAVGVLIALSISAINISWYSRVATGWVHTGLLQSDQDTYSAVAREIFERGNGFAYASAYEIRDATPAIYFQLPFFLLGWFWRLTRLGFPVVWEVFRVLSGGLTFFAIALVVRKYFPEKRWFTLAFIFVSFGAGVAWLVTLIRIGAHAAFGSPGTMHFVEQFLNVEQPYFWWFLNIFRNALYPLELFYHFWFFLSIYFLLAKKWRALAVSFFLACLSGVFVGAEVGVLLAVFCLVEYAVCRNKEYRKPLLYVLLVAIPFVVYYGFFLPGYPEGASLSAQHRQFAHELIPLHKYVQAYGLMFFLLPFAFNSKEFRRTVFSSPHGRLLLVWTVVVFFFMNNQWFSGGTGIQPPHFSRGYLFFPLAMLMLTWFRGVAGLRPFSVKNARSALLFLLLLLAPLDNVFFLYVVATEQPHPGVLTIARETQEVLDFLNSQPGRLHVLSLDRKLGVLIPAHTPHNSFMGDVMATPFWAEKEFDLERFLREGKGSGVLEKYSVDTIIVPVALAPEFERLVGAGEVLVVYRNSMWVVYHVLRH